MIAVLQQAAKPLYLKPQSHGRRECIPDLFWSWRMSLGLTAGTWGLREQMQIEDQLSPKAETNYHINGSISYRGRWYWGKLIFWGTFSPQGSRTLTPRPWQWWRCLTRLCKGKDPSVGNVFGLEVLLLQLVALEAEAHHYISLRCGDGCGLPAPLRAVRRHSEPSPAPPVTQLSRGLSLGC